MAREIKGITVHFPDGEVRPDVRVYEYPVKGDELNMSFGQGVGTYWKQYRVTKRVITQTIVTPHSIKEGAIHIFLAELPDADGMC